MDLMDFDEHKFSLTVDFPFLKNNSISQDSEWCVVKNGQEEKKIRVLPQGIGGGKVML